MKKYLFNHRSNIVVTCLLILMAGSGAYLRFYHIGKLSFWGDEIVTFVYSKDSFTQLGTILKTFPNMSFYYIFTHYWIRIFPNASDGTLRSLSAIFSVASIPAVFLLGRAFSTDRKKGSAIGLIAAFLITINAYHIQYAQEFRSYSLTFLLTTLSTFFLIKTIEDTESNHLWPTGYTLFTVAAVYSHLYSVFLVAAQAVTLPVLLLDKKKHLNHLKRILYCGIGMICLILPIAFVSFRAGTGGLAWISALTPEMVIDFFIEITGNQGLPLLALSLLFALIGLVSELGVGSQQDLTTRWKGILMASCFLLPVIAALVISIIMTPIFWDRYLLFVMPYIAVWVATGIVALASNRWKMKIDRFIFVPLTMGVLVLFALLSIKGIQYYYDDFQKEDLRATAQYLSTKCSDSLRLYLIPSLENDVLYYNSDLISQEDEWWNNTLQYHLDSDEIAASLPKEYSKVCLVLGPQPLGEMSNVQEKKVQAALQKEYPNRSKVDFFAVELEIYKR
jgi:mannosyltransferase